MKSTTKVSESITSLIISPDDTSCDAITSSTTTLMVVENENDVASSYSQNTNNGTTNNSGNTKKNNSNRKTKLTTMTTSNGQVRVIKHSPMTRQRRLTQQQQQQQQKQQQQKDDANTITSPITTTKVVPASATNSTSPSTTTNTSTNTITTNNSNNTMLSLEEQLPRLVADTTQLRHALDAFEYAYTKPIGWSTKYYNYFINAGIDSMNALYNGCKDNTINLDLEFIGVSYNDRIDSTTQNLLCNFLPGPVGIRCFRLAQMAAEKVRQGEADVKYVHRPENGQCGDEIWRVVPHSTTTTTTTNTSTSTSINNNNNNSIIKPQWTLHVDCAGFVRSVLKHITKDVVQLSLSDRSFMRAKDFYRLYETIDQTVFNFNTTNSTNGTTTTNLQVQQMSSEQGQQSDTQSLSSKKTLQWKVITDLRMVIPGDIIVYRPKGNAAGGAAFTVNDRCDLKHLLKAIKVALLYHNEMSLYGSNHLVTTNLGRHPSIKEYVTTNLHILNTCGIYTCSQLRQQLRTSNLNNLIYETFHTNDVPYYYNEQSINLMIECSTTTAKNTGHIVFAAGPALLINNNINEYRIKVVHSTKYGVNQTEGVQQYYRRFQLIEGHNGPQWTRRTIPTVPILSPKEKVVIIGSTSDPVANKSATMTTTTATTSLPMIPSMTNDYSTAASMSAVPEKTSTENNDSKNVITSDIASLTISLNNSTMNENKDISRSCNDKKKKNNLKKQKKNIDNNVVAPQEPAIAVVVVDDDDIDIDEATNDIIVSPPTSPAKVANLKRKSSSRSTNKEKNINNNNNNNEITNCTSTIAATSTGSTNKNNNNNTHNIKNDNNTFVNEEDNDDEDNDIDGDDPEDEQDAPDDNNNNNNNANDIATAVKQQKQKQQQLLVLSPKVRTETISTIIVPKLSKDLSAITIPPLPPSRPKKEEVSTKTKSLPTKDVHIIRDDDDDDNNNTTSSIIYNTVDNPIIASTSTTATCSTSTENEYVLTENDLLLLELINEEGGITSSSLNDELAGQANVEVLAARMCF